MFEVKKFVAFIAFNDLIREAYFDLAESRGIESTWDTYHVLAGDEKVPDAEVAIMEEIYNSHIKNNTKFYPVFETSVENFQNNLKQKIEINRNRLKK